MSEKIEELFEKIHVELEKLRRENKLYRDSYEEALEVSLKNSILGTFDEDGVKTFLREPYCVVQKRADEWYVIVPKFIDFNVGWLERTTESYNVFVINKFMNFLYKLPDDILEKFRFKAPIPLTVYDGMLLTGEEHQELAWQRYKKHLLRREGSDRIRIKTGKEFKLIASIIRDGILPFKVTPIMKEDLRAAQWGEEEIVLRDYQKTSWDKFLQTGAVGVYWPFSGGKTYLGLYAMARLKGKHLVVVPSTTLKEQWLERRQTFIPHVNTTVETYASYHKVRDQDWDLVIFDECHRLPANSYSRLSTLRSKYRIGLSATPYREDGRTNYIFALTGFPVGLDWQSLKRLGVIEPPDIRLYILKSYTDKLRKLKELLSYTVDKTIIFCDGIKLGKKISREYGIPHVYGETSKRLEVIKQSETTVVSRVGDEGLSVPHLRRVIEIDFLFGSRRQEGQRMGRLFHGLKSKSEFSFVEIESKNLRTKVFKLFDSI